MYVRTYYVRLTVHTYVCRRVGRHANKTECTYSAMSCTSHDRGFVAVFYAKRLRVQTPSKGLPKKIPVCATLQCNGTLVAGSGGWCSKAEPDRCGRPWASGLRRLRV